MANYGLLLPKKPATPSTSLYSTIDSLNLEGKIDAGCREMSYICGVDGVFGRYSAREQTLSVFSGDLTC